jgi:hypothetical protein
MVIEIAKLDFAPGAERMVIGTASSISRRELNG